MLDKNKMNGKTLENLVKEAARFLGSNNLIKAERCLKEAIRIDPDSDIAHGYLGIVYCQRDMPDLALTEFQRAYELDGQNPGHIANLGLVYYKKNLYDNALAFLGEAIEKGCKETAYLCYIRGRIFEKKGEHEKALGSLRAAEKLGYSDENLYMAMSDILVELERSEELSSLAKMLNKKMPNSEASHICSGLAYLFSGSHQNAMENFMEALSINNNNSATHNSLGMVLFKMERFREAEDEVLEALKRGDRKYYYYNNLGAIYFEMGRYVESLHALLCSIAVRPIASAQKNLVRVFHEIGDTDQVIAECRAFLNENPHFSEMNHLVATLLDYLDSSGEEAADYYQSIIKMMKSNPEFRGSLKPYGSSSNPVRIDITTPLSAKMFFIKCNDNTKDRALEVKRLEKEFLMNAMIYSVISEHINKEEGRREGLLVDKPIGVFKEDSKDIYLILKAKGRGDMQRIVSEKDELLDECAYACLNNLAQIQGIITQALNRGKIEFAYEDKKYNIQLEKFDYKKDMDKRIFDRFGHNKHSRILGEQMLAFIRQNAAKQEFFIHGDLYLTNTLETGAVIDWERAGIGDPVLDASLFLISTQLMGSENLFEDYFTRLIDASQRKLDFSSFKRSLGAHALFYSVCLSGSRIHHGDPANAKIYIRKAVDLAEEHGLPVLRSSFISYVDSSLAKHL